jgi:hypothetical protein
MSDLTSEENQRKWAAAMERKAERDRLQIAEETERAKWLADSTKTDTDKLSDLLRQYESIRFPLGIASPDAVCVVQFVTELGATITEALKEFTGVKA